MSIKGRGTSSPPPLLKNAASAPFVYFDNAPVYGAFSGMIEVELTGRILMPKAEGTVAGELVCVGHLRCSPTAALALAENLHKAIEIHHQQLARLAAQAAEQVEQLDNKAA